MPTTERLLTMIAATSDHSRLYDEIVQFCRRWNIQELALFGSALRNDFRDDSDLDFLVGFTADADWSLLDHVRMEDELESLIGREVDLVSRRAVEHSPNWIRRERILQSARTIFSEREDAYAG